MKEEFISKMNHIENRMYFHRKRKALECQDPSTFQSERKNKFRRDEEGLEKDITQIRGLSGVRLPHKLVS